MKPVKTKKEEILKAIETLTLATTYIATPEQWIQGAMAEDAVGNPVNYEGSSAVCFCVLGAMNRAGSNLGGSALAISTLYKSADKIDSINYISLVNYNDKAGRTHKEILELFQLAIDTLDKEL